MWTRAKLESTGINQNVYTIQKKHFCPPKYIKYLFVYIKRNLNFENESAETHLISDLVFFRQGRSGRKKNPKFSSKFGFWDNNARISTTGVVVWMKEILRKKSNVKVNFQNRTFFLTAWIYEAVEIPFKSFYFFSVLIFCLFHLQ
jgi:hypothetical protein